MKASRAELSAIAFDLDRYVSIEPRLRSARIVGSKPLRAGTKIEIVAEIPFSIPLVGAVLGPPKGVATVSRWSPSDELSADFDAPRFSGHVTVTLREHAGQTVVEVSGVARARSRLARLALLPVKAALEELARRSIRRAIARVDKTTHPGP